MSDEGGLLSQVKKNIKVRTRRHEQNLTNSMSSDIKVSMLAS